MDWERVCPISWNPFVYEGTPLYPTKLFGEKLSKLIFKSFSFPKGGGITTLGIISGIL